MNSFERNQLILKIVQNGNDDEQLNHQLLSTYDTLRGNAISSRVFRIILYVIFISLAVYEFEDAGQYLVFTFIFISYEFAYFNVLKEKDACKLDKELRRVNYDNIRNEYEYYSEYQG